MDLRTVRAYISHRLKVAGATTEMFHISARDLIFEATGGVPRLVNKLCDLSMVYTFTKGNQTVTRLTVQQVLDDGVFFTAVAGHAPRKPVLVTQETQKTKAD